MIVMEEEGKGFILSSADLTRAWRKEHGTKAGDPDDLQRFSFLDTQAPAGQEHSRFIMIGMDKLQPGGGIAEHYHICSAENPVFDHAYYVISGRIRATVGDIEKTVGADSLIYCPSNLKHAILNVGKGTAKVLRIKGSGIGDKNGTPVYTDGKEPRHDYWIPDKRT